MTLLEIERLARKIVSALQSPTDAAVTLKLAEDFAAACRASNARLRQCEAMLDAGDVPLAIQIAETAPNLLDLVARLEFRESEPWRSYCTAQRLPLAERIEDRAVQKLNDAYAQGIKADDQLYKDFRAAMLARKDFEALTIVRTIRRLNPNDTNAATEAARLDAKVLAARLTQLRSLLKAGSAPSEIAMAVESIEDGGFETPPIGDEWRQAQERRCFYLLDQAESARSRSDWRLSLSYLDLCRSLTADLSLIFDAAFQSRLTSTHQWAAVQLEEHQRATEFSQLLAELEQLLAQNEDKDTAARAVPAAEIKADYETLHRHWRKVRECTRPVPGELEARFHKRTRLLAAEIDRRNKRRVLMLASAATVALLVLGAAGWFALRQMKAGDFAEQLDAAIKARQLRTAERLIAQVRGPQASLLGVGTLSAAASRAESFVTRERDLIKTFEEAFARLPSPPAAGRPYSELAATQERFEATGKLFEGLPPDVQGELKAKMSAFQTRWEQVLDDEAPGLMAAFQGLLEPLRQTSARLKYTDGVETVRRLLSESAPSLATVEQLAALSVGSLQVKADLRQQAADASKEIKRFSEGLRQHETAVTALHGTKSFEDLAAAASLLAKSEFSQLPIVQGALAWRADALSAEVLFQKLIAPDYLGLVAYLKSTSEDRFIPKAAMPAEVKILDELKTVSDLSLPLRRWRLQPSSPGSETVEWIAFGAPARENAWLRVRAYEVTSASHGFALVLREYGHFGGKYSLTPQESLASLIDLGPCRETECLPQLDFRSLQAVNDIYPQPLLPVLSSVIDCTSGSAVVHAYVFEKLSELMSLQPEAWGIAFCPSANVHRSRLRGIVSQLKFGDWFVAATDKDIRPQLESFFKAIRSADYLGEARAFSSLARAAWKAGPRYAGYTDAEGKPQLLTGTNPQEAWGFSVSGNPVLLITAGNQSVPPAKCAPLSPVFVFEATRAELLNRAGAKPGDSGLITTLPPLFIGLQPAP